MKSDQSARKSTDFGKSWKSLTTTMGIFSTSDGTPCKSTKELVAKTENTSIMWASQTYHGKVNEGIIIKSTDGGASWFKEMGFARALY